MTAAADTLDDRLDLVFQAFGQPHPPGVAAQALERRRAGDRSRFALRQSLAAISRHLTVLERAGLIDRSINGRVHSCALDVGPMATAEEWLGAYRKFWTGQLDRLAEFVEEQGAEEKSR